MLQPGGETRLVLLIEDIHQKSVQTRVDFFDFLTFGRVFSSKKEEVVTSLSFVLLLLLFASSLMYYTENGSEPDSFSSIPAAMWWGVATLTTVGYGDVYPVTMLGRMIGATVAVLGIGMLALSAGILGAAFVEELQEHKGRQKTCPHCGQPID